MRKIIYALIALSSLCCRTSAQPFIDLLNVKYHYLPEQTDFLKENEKVNVKWLTARLEAPIKIKEDYLIFSPFYEQYQFDNSSMLSNNLYGIALPVTYLKQWKKPNWKTAFLAIPRISSDLENVSGNDYQMGGAVLVIYKKNDRVNYKFGLYYNSEFFGPFFIPLAGIDWKINDNLKLFGVLPSYMNLEYKTGKNIYTGIAFSTITNSFRLKNDGWYKVADNHLKLYADYYLTKSLVFNIEAGYSILRKYSYGEDMRNVRIEADLMFHDGPVLKAGVAWRIRLDGPDQGGK